MTNKNTNTNNNIIQILLENKKARRRRKKSNPGNPGNPMSYMKYNQMESKPFNLVNSLPNSSQLEDQKRVRFMEAMRDPFSTKSPYSIYDNGSNTFPIQGNIEGAEAPVYPQISQDDYFEDPTTRQPARQFSNPRRFNISDEFLDDFDNESDLSEIPLQTLLPGQQSGNSWFAPRMEQEQEFEEEEKFGISGIQEQPETRFSERVESQPKFATPFRAQPESLEEQILEKMDSVSKRLDSRQKRIEKEREEIENLEMNREDIESRINTKEGKLQEIRELRDQIKSKRRESMGKEEKPTMEEIRQERVKRAEEEKKQQDMIKNFTDLKTKLEELKKSKPRKTDLSTSNKEDKKLRKEFQELIKGEDYKFIGRTNIGNTTKIDTFIQMLEAGSKLHIQKLKELQAPTSVKYDEIRNPPRTKGNIQTFVKSAAGGGAVASRI